MSILRRERVREADIRCRPWLNCGLANLVSWDGMPRWRLVPHLTIVTVSAMLALTRSAGAQPVAFGSGDDPSEQTARAIWRPSTTLQAMGGFSLIGAQWRTATNFTVDFHSLNVAARAHGTIRAGIYGTYDADIDDTYDAARILDFVRVTPVGSNLYARAGPTTRLRLGTGHIVNFLNTKSVWDDRTVGLEGYASTGAFSVAAFADNFLLDRLIGGRAAIRPLFWAREPKARSLEIGATYVMDRKKLGDRRLLTAYGADLQFVAATIGDILFRPFGTFSWYENGGGGMGIGAELMSDDFVDVARFRVRLALYYSGDGFVPGHVGSFYAVSNGAARILKAEDLAPGDTVGAVTGVPLATAPGGTALETEVRLLFFRSFELWFSFRRHFGGPPLSEYHIRLFFRTGRLTAYVGQDRAGLKSFFTLFNDLGDQTWMEFQTDYHVARGFWIFVRAVYAYEEAAPTDDGSQRFLVQRRFEPFGGLRIRL